MLPIVIQSVALSVRIRMEVCVSAREQVASHRVNSQEQYSDFIVVFLVLSLSHLDRLQSMQTYCWGIR